MSGDNGKKVAKPVLTITFDDNGKLSVTAPMLEDTEFCNMPLCYYMLEEAKEILKLHNKKMALNKKIATPPEGIVGPNGRKIL